ncbi:adenylate/guanylate cyclase domain-containing protein [Nocardioides sp. HDW12B]|uniref:adenylate/guanylate cyclase domain-containing protein n=1 Tax=Nocardioides sp. HDW12B TaxID=2714939 RepID=UPI001F0DD0CF|nr:adenylate/guanylate cyclase domain-containing protein [Nocardioides sp. HDW12B]
MTTVTGAMTEREGARDQPPPDRPVYTSAEVAAAVGLSEKDARRFWMALGLPYAGEVPGYTEDDVATLRTLVEAGGSDVAVDTLVRLVRPVGQNVARMAEWHVAALTHRADPSGDPVGLAAEVGDALEGVLLHTWRRHVAAALGRLDADPATDQHASTSTVTVGFADLVKFSALSNELDVNRLGDLVEVFESRCGDVVTSHDGRLIKTLGDSVLFVADEPDRAVRIALGMVDVVGGDPRLPDVRLGLASGEIVTRMGDVFGPPVNLAARLTAVARRNRVIVDEATAAGLSPDRFETRRLSVRPLRGFGLVEPVAVRAGG